MLLRRFKWAGETQEVKRQITEHKEPSFDLEELEILANCCRAALSMLEDMDDSVASVHIWFRRRPIKSYLAGLPIISATVSVKQGKKP